MNPVLTKLLQSGLVERPDGSSVSLESNISIEDGLFIQQILSELQPMVTLEVGMAYGISTLFICESIAQFRNARHIVIDPFQKHVPNPSIGIESRPADPGWEGLGLFNVQRAGYLDIVDFREEPSYLALPRLVAEGVKIDFAFIDGMHTFDYVLLDFFYVDLLLNIGGIVVFDDVNYRSITKLCRFILQNRAYEVVQPGGQAVQKQSRIMRFFNHFRTLRNFVKPELLVPDSDLGITGNRQLCLRKLRDDTMMFEETSDFRNWATHHEF